MSKLVENEKINEGIFTRTLIYYKEMPKLEPEKKEVLEQILSGLESVNESLGTNYKLSKIYFTPFDSPASRVYSGLIAVLIRHYHSGNEFKEV